MRKLRIVAISDTHGRHDELDVPPGDVLLHAGDLLMKGTLDELRDAARWLGRQPHTHKLLVGGNHDFCLEPGTSSRDTALALLEDHGVTWLEDQSATIEGFTFYGSPWQPEFHNMAFNLPRGAPLAAVWSKIPVGVDVLLTHTPPARILDRTFLRLRPGCKDLTDALERVRPKLHVFGHIHEAHGAQDKDGRLSLNAASCNLRYRPVHEPWQVDISLEGAQLVRGNA